MDLRFLELFLHPSPFFNLFIDPLGDAMKLLDITLEEARIYQKYSTTHRVNFGLAGIDDQFVAEDAFIDPIQKCLAKVIRWEGEVSGRLSDGESLSSAPSNSNISSRVPR